MTLATLADVRELLRHVPKERRLRETWCHLAMELDAAVRGEIDPLRVAVALRMVLSLERVECRPA